MGFSTFKRSRRTFILKIDLPALLAFALFAGLIFFYLIPGFERAMMERKRALIQEITASAYSLLEYYHSLELKGQLESEKAKEEARSAISTIRYGESLKDYFWITDSYPRMIVHPYKPELNGKDLTDFHDSKGKAIFVEFVKAVSSTGDSYVDYMWQWNDDSTRNVPKLSYVRLFKPWGWIIGTGIYTEDVRAEIRRIEFRALVISGLIGVIIIILLYVISRQSHKIEKKRSRAEEELHKSRELYRTLAEAASEGVLIWSEHGLQANKTLLSWLDYTEDELQAVKLKDLFITSEFAELNEPDVLYDELMVRRSAECTVKTKNGNLLISHTDFSRILLGGSKAVMVVIRPAVSINSKNEPSVSGELLNETTIGFFKITYGKKSRFTHATTPTLKLLGFNNLNDLVSETIESFLVNPAQLRSIKLSLASKENVFKKEVLLKRKNGTQFWAILNILVMESVEEIWCEGTIEPLAANEISENFQNIELNKFSASYIMEVPVSSIMKLPAECMESTSAARALSDMNEYETGSVLITGKNGEPLGFIDKNSICRRLSEGADPETAVFRWMTSPPVLISQRAAINEAISLIQSSKSDYIYVTSNGKKITGVITSNDLTAAFSSTPKLLAAEINSADTTEALRMIYLKSRNLTISMILGHADPYAVSLFISSVADTICQRVLALTVGKSGDAPCRFAFIQTGSAGRREQTLSTDQDNAIIFEDFKGGDLDKAFIYFRSLGKRVNEMLAEIGFRYCIGEKMAGNPLWCQPVSMWKKYFRDWIKMPGPSEVLEMSIFFDFRFCFGDSGLAEELREYVRKDLRTSDIYFHHMALAWKQFAPLVNIKTDKKTDIKKLLMPLTGIIRLYALKYGINGFSTIERIIELYSGKYLDDKLLRDLIRAWKDLTSIRLMHHISCINNGEEPDNIVDFHLTDNDMLCFAVQAAESIKDLMYRAGNDFYTETI
jgi:signal-transduction protein with cAMP-binding, CBS, and nucleotidyltransferase domain/PAS domain-containing protein